eukprot:TRINITY_DN43793_c0_g1_i1.p1 TRINITY_DN43793_c0_g1~~TRINITY_DN43793_c0_g1_i1.p1  ORF type:complete len:863 (+),score=34.66 TRINITY_DN43793_c0_g1_i1:63-2651(+)
MHRFTLFPAIWLSLLLHVQAFQSTHNIPWESFLSRHDMVWEFHRDPQAKYGWSRLPRAWFTGGYTGNGLLGQFLYFCDSGNITTAGQSGRCKPEATKNPGIRLELGRQDLYTNRQPWTFFYNGVRLPVGYMFVQPVGSIQSGSMRLSLLTAELTGTLHTTRGVIQFRTLSHAVRDIQLLEVNTTKGEAGSTIKFHPITVCPRLGTCKGHPNPAAVCKTPSPTVSVCTQDLYKQPDDGQYATAVKTIINNINGNEWVQQTTTMYTTASSAFPQSYKTTDATKLAIQTVEQAGTIGWAKLIEDHRQWWYTFYNGKARSFFSFDDTYLEGLYWIENYKLASSMRQDGPMHDEIGPWYCGTSWAAVWTDLNTELTYWPLYTANRLAQARSLVSVIGRNRKLGFLTQNVVESGLPGYKNWTDSMGFGGAGSNKFLSPMFKLNTSIAEYGNLMWLSHNVWLTCLHEGNFSCYGDEVLPLIRGTISLYHHIAKLNGTSKLHIPPTRSPEYKVIGWDATYDVTLLHWGLDTYLHLCSMSSFAHAPSCDRMAEFHKFRNLLTEMHVSPSKGVDVYYKVPFDIGQRHFSHLLGYYPLRQLTYAKDRDLLRTSVSRYYRLTFDQHEEDDFTYSGVSIFNSYMGQMETALGNITNVTQRRFNPNGMNNQGPPGGPNITPESTAEAMHALQMIAFQWDFNVQHGQQLNMRVFPNNQFWGEKLSADGTNPFKDASFIFKAPYATLVSATRKHGKTDWVTFMQEEWVDADGTPQKTPYPVGGFYAQLDINTNVLKWFVSPASPTVTIHQVAHNGTYHVSGLTVGQSVTFYDETRTKPGSFAPIKPVSGNPAYYNYWGWNPKTNQTQCQAPPTNKEPC